MILKMQVGGMGSSETLNVSKPGTFFVADRSAKMLRAMKTIGGGGVGGLPLGTIGPGDRGFLNTQNAFTHVPWVWIEAMPYLP